MKKKLKEKKTEHLPNWRTEALRRGWPEKDIASLQELLATSKNEERVVEVETRRISILSIASCVFSGTLRDGTHEEHSVPFRREWSWTYSPAPVSMFSEEETFKSVWCPTHGINCDPHDGKCGAIDIASIQTCSCPMGRHHYDGCEVLRRESELSQLDADTADLFQIDGPLNALPKPSRSQLWLVQETKAERPTKANGWLLPGQLPLMPTQPRK